MGPPACTEEKMNNHIIAACTECKNIYGKCNCEGPHKRVEMGRCPSCKGAGAAFPGMDHSGNFHNNGMTLRDWFAGQAISGVLVGDELVTLEKILEKKDGSSEYATTDIEIARACYRLADAMLAERAK